MDYLKAAHDGLTTRYLGSIQRHFREYMKLLTEEENDTPVADEYTTEAYTVTPADATWWRSVCGSPSRTRYSAGKSPFSSWTTPSSTWTTKR